MKNKLLILGIFFLIFGMLMNFPGIFAENDTSEQELEDNDNLEIEEDENDAEVEIEIRGIKRKVAIGAEGVNASQIRERIREAISERNQVRFENKTGATCPEDCFCRGVVMSCELEDGTKQMTVYAQSGNIIVINIGGINMTTNVTLYHHDGRVFGVFGDNETDDAEAKEIKVLPDEANEIARERTRARLHNEDLILNEEGEYEFKAEKEARFLRLFKIKEKIKWHIDSETGEILKEVKPWWGFLANDIEKNRN